MAIEIDNAQMFQNRNALGQFPSKCRFVSRIRVHGSQCPPAFHKQPTTDNHGGTTDGGSGGGVEPPCTPLQKSQWIGGDKRQRGHAEDDTRTKSEHITDGIQQRVGGRREYEQSGRTRRTVHDANHKGAPETQITVCVAVRALRMRRRIVNVDVGVYMAQTVFVLMNVEVRALPPKAAQNIGTEKHEHRANHNFEHGFCPRRDSLAKDQQYAADRKQRCRVSETPEAAAEHECPTRNPTRAQRRYGGEMVGFQCVLHADQTTKQQQCVVFHFRFIRRYIGAACVHPAHDSRELKTLGQEKAPRIEPHEDTCPLGFESR